MYRHGDIMLRPCEPLTCGLHPHANEHESVSNPGEQLVLATGEATGHAHVLHGLAIAVTDYGRRGMPGQSARAARALMYVLEPAELRHEEHKTIAVPPGWYEVIRQRTYTPTAPRFVAD